MVNKRVQNAVLGCNLKNDRMISVLFRGKPFNSTVPTPVFLPGESQGRGSLVGCHLWGHTESDKIVPEIIQRLGQKRNDTQLWMFLVVKVNLKLLKKKNIT